MAELLGKDLVLKIGETTVSGLIDNSLNIEDSLIVVTSKDSVDANGKIWEKRKTGVGTWSIDVTSVYDPDGDLGWDDIVAEIINNSGEVTVYWGSTEVGHYSYEGNGIVESSSMSAPHDDKAEGSFTIQGSGEITATEIS